MKNIVLIIVIMEQYPYKNCETIEITTVAGVRKYKLPSSTLFSGKKVVAIQTYEPSDLPKSPFGIDLETTQVLKASYLTLTIKGKEKIKQIPLNNLIPSNMGGRIFHFEPEVLDLDKSGIECVNPGFITPGNVFCLTFYFEDNITGTK